MPGPGDGEPGDGHVDRPVEQSDRPVAPGNLAEPEPPPGQPFLQRRGDRRDQAAADAGVEADDEGPPDGLSRRLHRGDGAVPFRHDPPRRGDQRRSRLGQRDAAVSPGEQLGVESCLEGAHLLRQRRLGDEKHFRGPGEAELVDDGQERAQVPEVDVGTICHSGRLCETVLDGVPDERDRGVRAGAGPRSRVPLVPSARGGARSPIRSRGSADRGGRGGVQLPRPRVRRRDARGRRRAG